MLGVEAALEIRALHRHGKSTREIARKGRGAQHGAARALGLRPALIMALVVLV